MMDPIGFPVEKPPVSSSAGFMLIEVAVVLAVMMVVLAMFFGVLQSLTDAGRRVDNLVTNQESVRFGIDQMEREFRSANPLDVVGITSDYRNQAKLELGPTPGAHTYVRWLYDTSPASPTYECLLRQVMSGPSTNATVVSQAIIIARAHNVETATAVFSYYDAQDNDLVALNSATPANVSNCAIRIHVQINSDAQPGPQPFSENVDIELRNRLPGGILGC